MPLAILRHNRKGLSLIELLIAMAILAILAAAVLPMAELTVKRTKELELQRALRDLREAIDAWKDDYDRAKTEKKIITAIDETGYPESLQSLIDGSDWGGLFPFKRRYLRAIPRDPFAPAEDLPEDHWELRSYEDDPDSTSWGGKDIFDVHSRSDQLAINGTPYNTW
jgi:general secretion pathway protein G